MRWLVLVLFGVILFGSAFAAEGPVDITPGSEGRYTTTPLGENVTTEGGNVTDINLTTNASTEKWVGFYGNVTGNLLLSKGTGAALYVWTWNPSSSGEVCVSLNDAWTYWSALATPTPATMDTLFGFTTAADADTITKTLVTACSQTFTAAGTVTGKGNFTNNASNAKVWETCAFSRGTEAAMEDYVFCVNMSTTETAAVGGYWMYQVMAPIQSTIDYFDQYFFYAELT